jgi:hypothetical protein
VLRGRFQLDVTYICGLKPEHQSHAWLEVEGIVIDITADQIGLPPVIVSEDSQWHSEWQRERPRPPDAEDFASMLNLLRGAFN